MKKTALLDFAIVALMWAGSSSFAAVKVEKTFDYGQPFYSADLGGGCRLGFEFEKNETWGNGILLPENSDCETQHLSNISQILDEILDAAARDHVRFADYHTFSLGRAKDAVWRQRIVDCYIARYGVDSRKAFPDGAGLDIFDKCGVFRELEASFARHDVALRLQDNGEKSEFMDLSQSKGWRDPDVKIAITDNRRHRGVIFDDAMMYFDIVPLPQHR